MQTRRTARTGGANGAPLFVMLLIIGLGMPWVARAGDGEGEAVLYFGTPGGSPGATVHDTLILLGIPQTDALGARPLIDIAFGGARFWPAEADADLCPPGSPGVDLGARTMGAMRAILGWDYTQAIGSLEPLREDLACFESPVDGPSLGRAAVLLGYAHFESGDLFKARSAFAMAAAFDTEAVWDEEFPPDAKQVFLAAVNESLEYEDVQLRFSGRSDERELIELDERSLPRKGMVRPGLHLLSIPGVTGGPVRMAVRLPPDRTVNLLPTGSLVADWLEGAAASPSAARALGAALAREGGGDALLVDLATGRRFLFQDETQTVREIPVVTSELFEPAPPVVQPRNANQQLRQRRTAGVIVAGGGGLAAVGGFIAHGATYNMGLAETQRSRYEWERDANRAGFVIGVAGIATCVAGVVVALLPRREDARVTLIPGPSTTLEIRF